MVAVPSASLKILAEVLLPPFLFSQKITEWFQCLHIELGKCGNYPRKLIGYLGTVMVQSDIYSRKIK